MILRPRLPGFLIVSLLCSACLWAVPASAQTGSLDLLSLPMGARALGVGGAQVAVGGDPGLVLYNPAGVARMERTAVSYSLMEAPELFSQHLFVLGFRARRTRLAFTTRLLAFEPIPLTDEAGEELGSVSPQAIVLGVSVARSVAAGFSVGATAKWVNLDLANTSRGRGSGGAVDLGLQYRRRDASPLSIGVALLDLGPDLEVGGGSDPLPTRMVLGASVDVTGVLRRAPRSPVRVLLMLDRTASVRGGSGGDGTRMGVELELYRTLMLRGGLAPSPLRGEGRRSVLGLGVRRRSFRFDLAFDFLSSPALENQTHLSFAYTF